MEMTINNAILRYNLLSVIKFSDQDYSLPRELKIKLIRLKLDLGKVKDEFMSFQQKAMEEIKSEEYNILVSKLDKNEEEIKRLNEVTNELNEELNKLVSNKSEELIEIRSFDYLNDDEFNQILNVNIDNNPVINGNQIDFNTYIELLYNNFLKQ